MQVNSYFPIYFSSTCLPQSSLSVSFLHTDCPHFSVIISVSFPPLLLSSLSPTFRSFFFYLSLSLSLSSLSVTASFFHGDPLRAFPLLSAIFSCIMESVCTCVCAHLCVFVQVCLSRRAHLFKHCSNPSRITSTILSAACCLFIRDAPWLQRCLQS